MKYTVDINEVENNRKSIYSRYTDLLSYYDKLSEKYGSISYYWKGVDADNFIKKSKEYIENEKQNLDNLQKLCAILDKISTSITKLEDDFEDDCRKGGLYE